jgi:hypothetical protein
MSIHTCSYYCDRPECIRAQRDELRQKLEQAEKQEPSLWFAIGKDGRVKYTTDSDRALKWKQAESYRLVRDYYTSPVHASDISQERVDETAKDRHELAGTMPISNGGVATRTPSSFISPPKREWVSIPDWEIHEMYNEPTSDSEMIAFAREFEAKLKEKNT